MNKINVNLCTVGIKSTYKTWVIRVKDKLVFNTSLQAEQTLCISGVKESCLSGMDKRTGADFKTDSEGNHWLFLRDYYDLFVRNNKESDE